MLRAGSMLAVEWEDVELAFNDRRQSSNDGENRHDFPASTPQRHWHGAPKTARAENAPSRYIDNNLMEKMYASHHTYVKPGVWYCTTHLDKHVISQ